MNLRFYAGEALRTAGRDPARPATAAWSSRCARRSASSPRSRPGTSRSTSPPASSARRWPPATAWCSSRARSPRCSASGWSTPCSRAGCRPARSPSCTAVRRSASALVTDERVDARHVHRLDERRRGHPPGRRAASQRTQLEMGGKNPVLVLEDADLDRAATLIAKGAFGLSGQACTGTSRVIVARRRRTTSWSSASRPRRAPCGSAPGSPTASTSGPQASERQQQSVLGYVARALDAGATLVAGGPDDDSQDLTAGDLAHGLFVRPTVFTDVDPASELATAGGLRAGAGRPAGAVVRRGARRSPTPPGSGCRRASSPATSAGR